MTEKDKTKKELQDELEGLRQRTAELERSEIRCRLIEKKLCESENRHRGLFEDSPISLREEDFSDVKRYINGLRDSGVKDFRIYFENHPEDVASCAGMVKIVDINKASLELYKAKSKEEFRCGSNNFFSEESFEVFKEELISFAEGKTRFESEATDQTLTGEKIYIFLRCSLLPQNEARSSRVLVSIIDLTERRHIEDALHRVHDELERRVEERTAELVAANEVLQAKIIEHKQAAQALHESEARYRNLVESARDIIFTFSSDLKIAPLNSAFETVTGWSLAEYPGKNFESLVQSLVHPDDSSFVMELYQRLLNGEPLPASLELRILSKSGEYLTMEISMTPLTRNGKVVTGLGIARDITMRRRAEERVKEQAALLKKEIIERRHAEEKIRERAALLDKAQDAIAVRDLENRIIYWNKGAERLYGWTADEAMDKNANELLYKENSPRLVEAQKSVIEKGEWTGELHQVRKEDQEIVVESRWTLVHDSRGKPKSILIINTNITEKKKLEAQFLRAQRMESIGTLAGGIAHDLNNVLTPIMLSLQILKEKFKDEQSQKLLTILENNSLRGATLIKQVMSFARGVEGERVVLQVTHIIAEIEKIARETFPRSIEIRADIPKDLWTISGDATQLHQVIMNLCVNARDAMPDGGMLSISAENVFIDENYFRINIEAKVGSYIAVAVSDTGTGIPPEIMDRIFEPFFTTKGIGEGTGFGLSTALGIVKSHGGFINVYSEVGKGTNFKVYLPAVKTVETQKTEEQQLELPAGHGELVFVVDDEARILEITRGTLETYGYRVLAADDGEEAIALYAQNMEEIKVVLMDMMMPVMDGLTSIRALRKINPQIRIIGTSGLTEKDKLAKVTDINVHAFLTKPYTAERLLKTIHEVLSLKERNVEKSKRWNENKSNSEL